MGSSSSDAALTDTRARVARLAGQAQWTAQVAAAELQRLRQERARQDAEQAAQERRAIEVDVQHRFRRERDALESLLKPLQGHPAIAPWDAGEAWASVPTGRRPPAMVRLGGKVVPGPARAAAGFELPLLVPALGTGHLLVRAPEDRRTEALGVVEAAVVRMLASLPPGRVRFRIHDPVGMGASLGGFGAFASPVPRRGLPTTDAAELREAVDALVDHANDVSARHLRRTYATLTDFLEAAGDDVVPYELLVLLDYPTAVERDVAEQLERLAATAASRGIMLIVHEPERTREGARVALPQATAVWSDERTLWRTSLLPASTFTVDARPPVALVDAVAQRVPPPPPPVRFEELVEDLLAGTASSAEGLATRIGRDGRTPVEIRFDDETPHGLVAGDTGSGKSNLLRVALYGLARQYGPDELQLYLLDFKEGVEFREFAPGPGDPSFLPQARVVSTNSSRAFGVAVLEHLAQLTSQRYAMAAGSARKLSALRATFPSTALPRVLLVIDEFHVLFERSDRLSERAAAALTLIGKQGRGAGVHFLLATQAIGDVGAGNANAARLDGVFGAARLRIALRLDDRESQAILRMGNRAAADLHERGFAIVNLRQGHEDGNVRTKVALIDDATAARERRAALSRAVGARRPPRVFDGGDGVDGGVNQALRLAMRGRATAPQRTWIGTELALDLDDPRGYTPVALELVPDPHRHVAVVGAGARAAVSVLQWAAVGMGASDRSTDFLLVDLLRPSDAAPPGAVAATAAVLRELGCPVEHVAEARAAALVAALRERVEASSGRHAVVVFGFDRLVGMEETIEGDGSELYPPTPRSVLEELLGRAGTARTHLLGWWSTYDALEQSAGSRLALLGIRVYLRMPEQQLMLATGGACDAAEDWPLAVAHDAALGDGPRVLQVFQPFGTRSIPDVLRSGA
jgi:DNA segregation ATPase FtsK/SpoIIIE, S-DNA-T family